ncbi:MAG: protein phosphatase 2C domain-containing protein [Chloroflexota bacterium]|jgi:hypothetical protein
MNKIPLLPRMFTLLMKLVKNIFALFIVDLKTQMNTQLNNSAQIDAQQQHIHILQTHIDTLRNSISQLEQTTVILREQLDATKKSQEQVVPQVEPLPKRILPGLMHRPPLDTTIPYTLHNNLSTIHTVLRRYAPQFIYTNAQVPINHSITSDQYEIHMFSKSKTDKETNEDAMIFDLYQRELFGIVADGVSSTPMSSIASGLVCQYIHAEWKTSMTLNEFSDNTLYIKTQQLINEALYQAKYNVHYSINTVIDQLPTNNITDALRTNLKQKGSHATFALVFTTGSFAVCAWMGNTRIIFVDHNQNTIIPIHDPRFSDDSNRFSSHDDTLSNSGGIRGHVFIQVIDISTLPTWHAIILSDGLEEQKSTVMHHIINSEYEQIHGIIDTAVLIDDSSMMSISKVHTKLS